MAGNKPSAREPQPTYAVAELFPPQGQWTEEEYLALDTNRLVELSDGELEVLAVPSDLHQKILGRLCLAVQRFIAQHRLGEVRFAALRVRLWPGKFREPDLVFMAAVHRDRIGRKYWGVPDLAVEIISPDDPDQDRVTKLSEYAQAGIPEYWLIDLVAKGVEVYRLPAEANEYELALKLGAHEVLNSPQLPGFELALAELFAGETA